MSKVDGLDATPREARDTPRCNALASNPLDSFDYRAWATLAEQLERDLDTCRDAHMANCLAADTLRTEIRTVRDELETCRAVTTLCCKKGTPPSETAPTGGEAMYNALGSACIARILKADAKCEPQGDVMLRLEAIIMERDALLAASATRPSTDTERMDWLERFNVEVRQPLVHGSHHLFDANPVPVEGLDDEPSNLRKQIDYQRNGGPKP